MADQDDQIKDENLNEEVEELDQSQEEAQEELQPEEQEVEETDQLEEEAPVEQPEEQQEQPMSRRKELRIQKLVEKLRAPQQQNLPQNQGVDFREVVDADDATYDQLSQRTQQFGSQQYQEGLNQAKAITFQTRLEVDAPKVANKYPVMDPESDSFNPAVADSINQMFLSAVGYDQNTGSVNNSDQRYYDYVGAIFELADEAASRKVETTQKNITRQAANTALRPDGRSNETLNLNKEPHQMSDKELDAKIAQMGMAPKKR